MAAKKARKTKKAPSAKQLAARRKFALAAKARSKAAKAKRPAKKRNATIIKAKRIDHLDVSKIHSLGKTENPRGKKRNGTTIKARKVTILNLKKNPAFEILKEATPATKGSQSGWKLGKSFYAKGRGQAKLPGGALLDLGSGFVYRRVANPKRRKNVQMMGGGGAFPIRASADYDPVKAGESPSRKSTAAQKRTRKATQKKIKAAGGVKKFIRKIKTRKAATRKAGQTRSMTAATKQRKATTTRLASRLLDRSGPKKTRRNPNTYIRYHVFLENAYGVKSSGKWAVTIAEARQEARRLARLYDSIGVMIEKVEMSNGGRDERVIERIWHQKPTKRNPNAGTKAAYESFQGKPSTKSTSLNFPNGTPVNVYKLGTLHSITLQSGAVVKPAGSTVWLCADTKGKLHLGTSGERLVNAPKGALGKVKEVEYITTKPHLGDNKPTRYYHELGEETGQKPTLYSDGNGGLLFKGGATYIPADGSGIHN